MTYPDNCIIGKVPEVSKLPTNGGQLFGDFTRRLSCTQCSLKVLSGFSESHDYINIRSDHTTMTEKLTFTADC